MSGTPTTLKRYNICLGCREYELIVTEVTCFKCEQKAMEDHAFLFDGGAKEVRRLFRDMDSLITQHNLRGLHDEF
jgi:hypothetical protein